ncbi:putative receptor-like protein kinase FERONIA-like [Capsicum annuum]|nr:putative receptor-like protein kinase FERONIA-like [Capsicum annuum]
MNMLFSHLFVLSVFMFMDHLIICAATNVHENVAISCGASGNFAGTDGRVWVGDASYISSLLQLKGKSLKSSVPPPFSDSVPYKSARTSRHEFTYQFSVKPGQKFIRMHFKPASYKGFKKSKAIFTVKTGEHTLLSDFTPTLAEGMSYFKKEFCINVQEDETLSITFIPSRKPGFVEDTYAFVNGIEVVSMPAGLYFTPDGDVGVTVVGRKYRFYIDNNTALETIQRINVGGNSISSLEDAAMFRDWEDDTNYLKEVGGFSINRAVAIRYTYSATHIAPKEVYQTARTVGARCHSNVCKLTWDVPLDLGFRYLVRLHFCEIEPAMTKEGQRNFTIVINNQKAEEEADVIKWSGGHGISVYKDYVAIMEGDRREGKHKLSIVLQPNFATISKRSNAILNGIEVFKISNPDNNLGGVSPVHPTTSSTPAKSKSVLFATKNKIATVLTFVVTLINVALYYIRCNSEINSGKTNNKLSFREHQCRQFSLDEMVRSTNNFDPQLVIGSGGFGTVYKGDIDGGETAVAVKRLKPGSRQGENEFWAEIKMLPIHCHENLLSLIGYCKEGDEMLLVYEYMSRGTLAEHLHKMNRSGHKNSSLSWEQRLKIAIGAARGLDFLHTSQDRVIHRDVKSSNILLDENWGSKISDFGLSKMGPGNESATHVITEVKGTFGYLDPEYFLTKRLTWKTDVYAFGVVLFELLSGRAAVDMQLPEEQHALAAWAKQCIVEEQVHKLIDQNLAGPISSTSLKAFVGTAAKCLDDHPHERPPMSKVVKSLELALVFQQSAGEGIISFDDTSTSHSKVGAERASSIKEGRNGIDITKRKAIPMKKVKSKDRSLDIASPRWRDFLGLFPKAPPKPKPSPTQPQGLHHFSLFKMLKATKDFHESLRIGYLGADNAYVGVINGQNVAVRRSHTAQSRLHMVSELQAKTTMTPLPSHVNMVSLIGFCRNYTEMILVYDYAAGGTVHDYLRDPDKNPLRWKQRLEICIGAAEGLNYLRSILKITILHRIFDSSYIWLDENCVAKVSEVSWSKTRGINKAGAVPEGGYLDSDCLRDERLTEKSYVYSFGLVLFEMLCANEALNHWLNEGQISLAQWIKTSFMTATAHCIHPCLVGRISPDCFALFVNTALNCLHDEGIKRPSMSDIITSLKEALNLQEAYKIT